MQSIAISAVVGVLTFGMGLLGLYLRRLLPDVTCRWARAI